jgi:hypothetical protein
MVLVVAESPVDAASTFQHSVVHFQDLGAGDWT